MARFEQPLGIVLAGGEGKRLMPLTADRAKPAVPFGGSYRLVDFVLSNLVNAEMRKIAVLTQYKSHSLDRHITTTWRMSTLLGNYVTPVPAHQYRYIQPICMYGCPMSHTVSTEARDFHAPQPPHHPCLHAVQP